ncbi:NADH dehydrogenase subunit 5 [Neobacillus sp. YIM B02564]|uniref:Probable inorganic carbon transporter subunit DabB n=1 Tax=Neobacillus paridis TaxID=2803862 RepID=A0ABS1TQG7_9BACI|nr:NADH dehydrogenase subunit 5 [Neobacillus paridis]MBL4953559.1 NADH dehydrogenase subunit 5 [Neobacillus paridis]
MLALLAIAFLLILAVSLLSALFLLHPKVPLSFVQIHVGMVTLLPIIALVALVMNDRVVNLGPFRFDSLSWLVAMFVLTIGLIVQRFSIRYIFGDRSYRKYFALLTFTVTFDVLAWLSDDLRLLLLCWGATLLGLTLLIYLKQEWQIARNAALLAGRMLAISWLGLFVAILWIAQETGHWQLSLIVNQASLAQISSWETTCIDLLLIVSVVIPAAQWPFQRWLLDSVVAPTPISAVMHAGIVNAGGMIMARFAPLFSGNITQIILLLIATISVLIGTGIMLVQVDYKRQLVGSTIAQMGFMLIQCALGAYIAAMIHAVLHGIFKSTLFLQAGSAIHHNHQTEPGRQAILPTILGGIIALLTVIGFWQKAPGDGYQWISALILGSSVLLAWKQLIAFSKGLIGRVAGLFLFTGAAVMYSFAHRAFARILGDTVKSGIQPPTPAVILVVFVLLAGSAIAMLAARHRSSTALVVIYLWLVRLGEPKEKLVESHPKYLTQSFSQGGHLS